MFTRRIICCFLLSVLALAARPWVLLFGSVDCSECAALKQYWKSSYNSAEAPILIFADILDGDNYDLLSYVEKTLKIQNPSSTFPVLLVGNQLVAGRKGFNAIESKLPALFKEIIDDEMTQQITDAANKATEPVITFVFNNDAVKKQPAQTIQPSKDPKPDSPANPPQNGEKKTPEIHLAFFKLPECQKCSRQELELAIIKEKIPAVVITFFDTTTLEGQAMLTRARNAFNLPPETINDATLVPMVAWNGGFINGRLATAAELEEKLAHSSDTPEPFWLTPVTQEELNQEKSRLEGVINALTWWSVIGGGLADGINPCAFATSIFLISYLLYLKRRKRDIVLVGTCFCIGVFLTYFAYGLALSYVLDYLQKLKWLKICIYGVFSLIGFVLCFLHFRDALKYKKSGNVSDMNMGLSHETHRGIHEKIRKFMTVSAWLLLPSAIILGAVISSMELACTGQVYFPIIAALLQNGINQQFLLLLLLYNVCFIVPLAIITVLAAFGVGSKALANWAKDHVFSTKIIMAILFACLGILMLALLFR